MKEFIIGIVSTSIIIAIVFIAYQFGMRNSQNKTIPKPSNVPTSNTDVNIDNNSDTKQEPMVGNDGDEHGCKGSAGYSWCEAKQKCLRVWEEPCVDDESQSDNLKNTITAQLKTKYIDMDWEMKVEVSKIIGGYASGGVRPAEGEIGGAMWLAAKTSGDWVLVWDGNGTISCAALAPYPEFPSSLAPQCWNESSQKIINR